MENGHMVTWSSAAPWGFKATNLFHAKFFTVLISSEETSNFIHLTDLYYTDVKQDNSL